MKAQETVLFEAVIVPHRSLSGVGVRILLGVVLAACVGSSTAFVLLGAWPVGVFAGLELVLAAVLSLLDLLAARAGERRRLAPGGRGLGRAGARGRVETSDLPADWMAVRLEERHGRVPALVLQLRGQAVEVGRELGEDAKRSLAEALAEALHRRRNPVFDNPQLR